MTRAAFLVATALLLAAPASSRAQGQLTIRGFGDAGLTVFTATQSFKAILGKPSGPVFGGGVEVGLPNRRLFVSLAASRFRRTGHRVFIFDNQVFALDVADTITVTPLELTGGYRFRTSGLVPYAGAGVGWHRFQETSAHATTGDDVKFTKTGFHVLGGVELPVQRWLAAGVDAQWSAVPNAFGEEATSVGNHYGEHDLGGFTLRAKIIVGR